MSAVRFAPEISVHSLRPAALILFLGGKVITAMPKYMFPQIDIPVFVASIFVEMGRQTVMRRDVAFATFLAQADPHL
jgi:hypothetical protein